MLSREQLLNGVCGLATEIIDLPELGGSVFLQGPSAIAAFRIAEMLEAGDKIAANKALVMACLVDSETRKPILQTEDEAEQFFQKIPPSVFTKLAIAANRLSEPKNSEATPGDASSSASRSRSGRRLQS